MHMHMVGETARMEDSLPYMLTQVFRVIEKLPQEQLGVGPLYLLVLIAHCGSRELLSEYTAVLPPHVPVRHERDVEVLPRPKR